MDETYHTSRTGCRADDVSWVYKENNVQLMSRNGATDMEDDFFVGYSFVVGSTYTAYINGVGPASNVIEFVYYNYQLTVDANGLVSRTPTGSMANTYWLFTKDGSTETASISVGADTTIAI
jgi:hypothetical protein